MEEANSYLYNWEDSVENFFAWVIEGCGYDIFDEEYIILNSLIKNMDDLGKFISFFNGNLDLNDTIDCYISIYEA